MKLKTIYQKSLLSSYRKILRMHQRMLWLQYYSYSGTGWKTDPCRISQFQRMLIYSLFNGIVRNNVRKRCYPSEAMHSFELSEQFFVFLHLFLDSLISYGGSSQLVTYDGINSCPSRKSFNNGHLTTTKKTGYFLSVSHIWILFGYKISTLYNIMVFFININWISNEFWSLFSISVNKLSFNFQHE